MMRNIFLMMAVFLLFISCKQKLTEGEAADFKKQGIEIVESATKELGMNLMSKMKEGGVDLAIPFCHASAMPITGEIAKKYQAEIKRTSYKIRNPKNIPNEEETEILTQFLNSYKTGIPAESIVQKVNDNKIVFYAPIIMKKQCLACHGIVGQELAIRTDSIIKSFYPDDQATGFKEGELRGLWKVTFNK